MATTDEDIVLRIDGKGVSRTEFNRVLAEVQELERINGPFDDPEQEALKIVERMMAYRAHQIKQKARVLIEACSMTHIDNGTFRPRRSDMEYAISLLLRAMPDKAGRGRPRSPKMNGPRLRTLRIEAGMTQAELIDAVKVQSGYGGAFPVRSLRRYESSGPADPSYVNLIAEILTAHLSRTVTPEDLTFDSIETDILL